MPERPVGVEDKAGADPVIAEYRVRDRTVSATTVSEQWLIKQRERVARSMASYALRAFVLQSADGTTSYRLLIRNPTGSGMTIALREVVAFTSHVSISSTLANAPAFTLERWTSTGTPTGGTQLTPGRILSGQAPLAQAYTAAPTGLTNAKVATFWTYFPSVNLSTVTTDPQVVWPVAQDYHTTDPSLELAPGEAIAFRQNEASSVSETTSRAITFNVLIEEFTKP